MALVLLITSLLSGVVAFLGFLGLAGKLPPNHFAGIRTPFTLHSAENWHAAHRAGGPYLVLLSVAALAAGLAFVPFALAGMLADPLIASIVAAQCVLLTAGVFSAWRIGAARARSHLESRHT